MPAGLASCVPLQTLLQPTAGVLQHPAFGYRYLMIKRGLMDASFSPQHDQQKDCAIRLML